MERQYIEIGGMDLPGGGRMRLFNELVTGSAFAVDERDGQTIEGQLFKLRQRYEEAESHDLPQIV